MKRNCIFFTAVICASMMFGGCEKETEDEFVPANALRLTAEGHVDYGTKHFVDGNDVMWIDEWVKINGLRYQVTVTDDGKAYIDRSTNGSASASDLVGTAVYGYYGPNIVTGDGMTTTPTAKIPNEYWTGYGTVGLQQIQMPMVAYSPTAGSTIQFKHLSAAVNVMLWNATDITLTIDSLVLKTANYRINGDIVLDLTAANYNIGTYSASTSAERKVKASVSPWLDLPAGDRSKSFQIPILPIGEDDLTIEVYCHNKNDQSEKMRYHYTSSTPALARNEMLTAKVKLDLEGRMAHVVNISTISQDYTVQEGDVLTGVSQSQSYGITVPDGTTFTLKDADFTYVQIICEGDATIVVEGSNKLRNCGTRINYAPLIFVPEESTLTIRGDGSLSANGSSSGAAIGCHWNWTRDYGRCGNIVIESGDISVESSAGPAIGGKYCGNISLLGGNITAITSASGAPAIGCSEGGSCGDITISSNVKSATMRIYSGNTPIYIGAGSNGTCGTVTIDGVEDATPSSAFPHFTSTILTTSRTNDTWTLSRN